MQDKYRLYRRSNRAQGTFYAQNSSTGARESLGTKNRAEAKRLLQAKNDAHSQPILSRELAKVYLQAQDPRFGKRTWGDVARLIDGAYEGNTKERFQKFLRSAAIGTLASDPEWLSKATRMIAKHWIQKNARKKSISNRSHNTTTT